MIRLVSTHRISRHVGPGQPRPYPFTSPHSTLSFTFRVHLLVHKTLVGHTPDYIFDLLTPVADIPTRLSLRAFSNAATATSFFTDGVAIRKPRVLCRCTPCVESVADRTETHAVVDNNIQASSKDNSVQLSTLLPLTTDYRMRHRTNCRRRTTNAAVTVTDIISSFIKKLTNATIIQIRKK